MRTETAAASGRYMSVVAGREGALLPSREAGVAGRDDDADAMVG